MNQRFPLSVRFITAVSSQFSLIACDDAANVERTHRALDDGGPERLGYSPQLGAERGGDSDEPDMRIVMRGGRPDDDGATGQVTLERTPPVREVEGFPFPEAPLSDGRYFEDRMARFADDPVYWVPLPAGQTSPP